MDSARNHESVLCVKRNIPLSAEMGGVADRKEALLVFTI